MAKSTHNLTLTEINQYFYEEDGQLKWKIAKGRRVHVGDVAGYVRGNGYEYVEINNFSYGVHRLLYQIYNNIEDISDVDTVDHIDGNPRNNNKDNLRAATSANNQHNVGIRSTNKSGYKNIFLAKTHKGTILKWQLYIRYNGKYYQKLFPHTDEGLRMAVEHRDVKLIELHGEFANKG